MILGLVTSGARNGGAPPALHISCYPGGAAPRRMRAASDAGDGISRLADRKALGGRPWFLNLIRRRSLPLNLDRCMVSSIVAGRDGGGLGMVKLRIFPAIRPVDALRLARPATA